MARQIPKYEIIRLRIEEVMKIHGRMTKDDLCDNIPEASIDDIKYGLKALYEQDKINRIINLQDTRRKFYALKN